jgi:hypothetical protein
MLVFVDESGDPGLKLGRGSSSHFVVALVVFHDHEEARAADARISLLRRELRMPANREFHFNKCSSEIRSKFMKALAPYNFFFYCLVFDKAAAGERAQALTGREPFYMYACGLVFENARHALNDAVVVLDGSGSRSFRRKLQSYLMRRTNEPGSRSIRSVRMRDSKKDNLLQLADMVAGAVYRSFEETDDAISYLQQISHRAISIQIWPK